MSHETQHDDARDYDRARDAFNDLGREAQARFLAETTVSAVAHGVKNVSRALADEFDAFFGGNATGKKASTQTPPSGKGSGPGPAEPPTDAQRRPSS